MIRWQDVEKWIKQKQLGYNRAFRAAQAYVELSKKIKDDSYYKELSDEAESALVFIRFLHDYCDRQCKEFPHKTAENYAYWDIQDRIAIIYGKEEKL